MFSVATKVRSKKVRAMVLAVAIGAVGLTTGLNEASAASGWQPDKNYMPNGCVGKTHFDSMYMSTSRGWQFCDQWAKWYYTYGPGSRGGVKGPSALAALSGAPAPAPARTAAPVNYGGIVAGAGNPWIVNAARSQLGKPYVYGATGPNAWDCSSLTQFAYSRAGKSIPRTSTQQNATMQRIPLSQLTPGDLVWQPGHVAIYSGNGMIIEAANPSAPVRERTMYPGFVHGLRKW